LDGSIPRLDLRRERGVGEEDQRKKAGQRNPDYIAPPGVITLSATDARPANHEYQMDAEKNGARDGENERLQNVQL
jgi:hypothetical protein